MKVHCSHDRLVPIGELVAHPKNRNSHPAEQIDRLAAILRYQGFRYPVKVSNQSGFITSGHGRVEAAKLNGWKEVPVNFQDYDTDEQEYADVQADNAIASWSVLDLGGINSDLGDLGPDLDIDMLGIRDFVIEPADKLEPGCDEDEVPEHVEPRTKLGDIYQLGRHRLMCGDSTSIDAVEKLMDGQKADMVFTDPPYGVSYEGGQNKKTNKKLNQIQNDSAKDEDLSDLFASSLSNAFAVCADHTPFYVWYSTNKAVETFSDLPKIGIKIRSIICWYKINSRIGSFMSQYIPNYEPCIYGHKKGCSPSWYGPTDEKAVWAMKKEGSNDLHPTQKPVELPERAILNSSKASDSILDLFGGSGSTLIACEKTNRNCFMMELDPKYCDVIVARWEKYTGQEAKLLNGQT